MSTLMLTIVEVSMNKIALGIHADVDDWTAEKAIIASNHRTLRLSVESNKRSQ